MYYDILDRILELKKSIRKNLVKSDFSTIN